VIRLADLVQEPYCLDVLEFEEGVWDRLIQTVRSLGILDAETMDRLAAPGPCLQVTVEQARKIGNGLEVWLEKDLTRRATPPVIPSYIVPIAASNGVWIDPALPLINQKLEFPTDLFELTFFCLNCSGFSVN
jgi:hypothetical protein